MFTVTSQTSVLGRTAGEVVSEQELIDAGVNIPALLASNNIQPVTAAPTSTSEEGANPNGN